MSSGLSSNMDSDAFVGGIELFNRCEFFQAHEVLEDIWRECMGEERKFLQGLIQAAVAFHHHSSGNLDGARSLLDRALKNLADYPDEYRGIKLRPFRDSLLQWQQAWACCSQLPELPRLERDGGSSPGSC